MGYESRLYVVEKFNTVKDEDGKSYARVISMFDMCKFLNLSNILRYKPATDCYFYADDGNTRVLEDKYGKPLTESTVEFVIGILEKEVENGENYWRIFPLLSTLKTIKEHGLDSNFVVLHYGY